MDLLQKFRNEQIRRSELKCPHELAVWLDHCQYVIHAQFDKNQKKKYKSKKRKEVNEHFKNAIENLNREQKVEFYLRIVFHLNSFNKGEMNPPPLSDVAEHPIEGECEARSFNLKIWKVKKIRIDRKRHQIMVEKQNKIKTYPLQDYIMRSSKIKDKHAFVLEAINDRPHEKSRTVHLAFKNTQFKKWQQLTMQSVRYCEWLNVKRFYRMIDNSIQQSIVTEYKGPISKSISSSQTSEASEKQSIKDPKQHKQQMGDFSRSSSQSSNRQQQKSKAQSSISYLTQKEQKLEMAEEMLEKEQEKILGNRKTFIDHLVNDDCTDFDQLFDQLQNETAKDVQQKKNLDFFHRLMPEYQIDNIKELVNFKTLSNESNAQILQDIDNPFRFKIILDFQSVQYTPEKIISILSEPQHALVLNSNISQQTVKTMVKSQNSAIMYQTNKPFNKFYRLRDFIYLRHVFIHKGNTFMIDKSIDNMNYPPFMTLVRGQISAVWGIFKNKQNQLSQLIGDLTIVNSGYLNNQQQASLSVKYLEGFKAILNYPVPESNYEMFKLDWNIDEKKINKQIQQIRVRKRTIQVEKQKINEFRKKEQPKDDDTSDRQSPFKKKQVKQQVQHIKEIQQKREISLEQADKAEKLEKKRAQQKTKSAKKAQQTLDRQQNKNIASKQSEKISKKSQLQTTLSIKRKFDSQGLVVPDKTYIKKRFITEPIQKPQYMNVKPVKGHSIWKGDWEHDGKNGGMMFVNQKKMQDQKGVLKFVLTKIGKNILSGKSVLNISLPVDIFSPESNLERLIISMSYGPKLLQNLNQKSALDRLQKVVCFGITNSVMYINMQKPFNPILGQTFQCWINGCPAYAQQISHHPPIGSLMFYGRGYKITCQLQSKVQLHMNSGCGSNDGVYRVNFDDGVEVCFTTPGGQISGLTYGDRKLNLVGKSYYWNQKQRIFCEIQFDAGKKGFFSKTDKPADYFEGKVFEVTKQFFTTFFKNKKKQVNQKEKVKQLGCFEGIWNKFVKFNGIQIINLDKQTPLQIQYEQRPLPSDANWRQDIQYRRIKQTTRAQTQKQRLQVIQRKDRKFRADYAKKK